MAANYSLCPIRSVRDALSTIHSVAGVDSALAGGYS